MTSNDLHTRLIGASSPAEVFSLLQSKAAAAINYPTEARLHS